MLTRLDVFEKGFVRLEDAMGDDLSIVNAAKVSYGNKDEILNEGHAGLINFLMKHRHGSPFEHVVYTFHVKTPIFVAREWVRHRIGSYNEISGRYKELAPEFYIPKLDDVRVRVGKPGYYTYSPAGNVLAERAVSVMESATQEAWDGYQEMLRLGIAPEVSRMCLPLNIYTEFYWTVNARSLMNFLSLRTHETAQFEIRAFACAIEEMFEQHLPYTYHAWVNNDRIAP